MKKKSISFIMAFMMMFSLVPSNVVLAEGETANVTKGMAYVDDILSEASTVDDYFYSERLVKNISDLSNWLSGRPLSDEETIVLNGYVNTKTNSVYSTLEAFFAAYSYKQSVYLNDLLTRAKKLHDDIVEFLSQKLDKDVYEQILELYDDDEVISYYQNSSEIPADDQLEHFGNIIDLMNAVKKAEKAISEIPALSSAGYSRFETAVNSAQEACQSASVVFDRVQGFEYAKDCLPTSENGVGELIDGYDDYENAFMKLKIEQAYYNVGTFSKMTEDVKDKIKDLKDAVAEADEYANVSVNSLYNRREILDLIQKYDDVVEFEEKVDALSENLTSTTEVTLALQIYESFFEKLDADTQKLVPDEYLTQIKEALAINTGADTIAKEIDEIGIVESEDDVAGVAGRLEKAYADYRTFLMRYAGVRGVADMIPNAEVLDDETSVIALVKSIAQLAQAGDMTLSSNAAQLTSVKYAYDNLKESLKPQIYNADILNEIYDDAQNANKVVGMIAGIQNNFTLEDEEYIQSVRNAYNELTNNAKVYVGDSRTAALNAAEEQLYALNSNVAARTSALINNIGNVTAESKEPIEKARASYNSLNVTQKQMVSNYSVLTAAEAAYKKLNTSLEKATVTGLGTYEYSGVAIKPSVTVKLNGIILVKDVDYTVTFSDNTEAGTAKMLFTGIGNYSGKLTKTFKIKALALTLAEVTGYKKSYKYKRAQITPDVKVVLGGKTLDIGADYTVKYVSNKNAGTAKIYITGKNNYQGTLIRTFKIKKISLKKVKFSKIQKRIYRTGKLIKPSITLKWKGKKLKKGRDYKITYSNNRWVGTASMKITGKGNFKGTKKYTFTIY